MNIKLVLSLQKCILAISRTTEHSDKSWGRDGGNGSQVGLLRGSEKSWAKLLSTSVCCSGESPTEPPQFATVAWRQWPVAGDITVKSSSPRPAHSIHWDYGTCCQIKTSDLMKRWSKFGNLFRAIIKNEIKPLAGWRGWQWGPARSIITVIISSNIIKTSST